jgi:hypothetical protein
MFYGPAESASKQIRMTRHAGMTTVEHMRLDHGGLHIAVAKKLLDRSDLGSALQQVGGEAMAKGVATGRFADPCSSDRGANRPLNNRGVEMMPSLFTRLSITPTRDLREHPLPNPFARS